jgi:NHL repeat
VIVEQETDSLIISDWGNERVVRWCREETERTVVAGGNKRGEGTNQFRRPIGLSVDRHGNLYVADYKNHRVQRFSIEMLVYV